MHHAIDGAGLKHVQPAMRLMFKSIGTILYIEDAGRKYRPAFFLEPDDSGRLVSLARDTRGGAQLRGGHDGPDDLALSDQPDAADGSSRLIDRMSQRT